MNVFLSFIAAFSYFRLQICFNEYKCIHTQQNTFITATWGKRSGKKIHVLMSTKKHKHGPVKRGKNAYNEMLFSFKISFPQLYFKQPLLVIRMNLIVLWNNGDHSKAIKFFSTLLIPVTFISHPLNTDDRCQRGKTSTNGKTIKK